MEIPTDSPPSYHRFPAVAGDDANALYGALADEKRRTTLSVLEQRTEPTTVEELSTLVAAREAGLSPDAVADADREQVLVRLAHIHLPRLEASGLLRRTEDGRVDRAQHSFWTDSKFRRLLGGLDAPSTTVTGTLRLLSNDHRRTIISVLNSCRECTVSEMVATLLDAPLSSEDRRRLLIALDHVHIPMLAGEGVVELSSDRQRLRYEGNVVLDEWWLSDV